MHPTPQQKNPEKNPKKPKTKQNKNQRKNDNVWLMYEKFNQVELRYLEH